MAEDLGIFEGLDQALDRLLRTRPESATELADAIGVTRSSLSRYRRGRGLPSVGALGRLLSRCGVPLSQLEDLLIEARGESEPAPASGAPEYLPLGLLVLPLGGAGLEGAAGDSDRVQKYLRRLLLRHRIAPPRNTQDQDEGSSDG